MRCLFHTTVDEDINCSGKKRGETRLLCVTSFQGVIHYGRKRGTICTGCYDLGDTDRAPSDLSIWNTLGISMCLIYYMFRCFKV